MKTRDSVVCALGLAVAISIGAAGTAGAQRKTTTPRARPAQSIPVKKDVPSVAARTDTIRVSRVDTVFVRRTDTVSTTMMRTDTVTQMMVRPLSRQPGLYFGLGGGVAIPMNNFRNVVKDGPMITGQIGWFPAEGMLGLRGDASYAKLGHRETDCKGCPDKNWLTAGLDVIARFPLDRYSSVNPTIYFLAGAGVSKLDKVPPFQNTDGRWVNANGTSMKWEVGPGVSMKVGGLNMFAEGKYTTIRNFDFATQAAYIAGQPHGSTNTHLFPITVGVQFF